MKEKYKPKPRPLKRRFEDWFRSLTGNQVRIFLAAILAAVVITAMNNPAAGYERTSVAVRTPTLELATKRWKDNGGSGHPEWFQVGQATEGGYFFLKKNPWWWPFAYESEAFYDWESENDGPPSWFRFKTLGGLLAFLASVAFAARLLMWLAELRTPPRATDKSEAA